MNALVSPRFRQIRHNAAVPAQNCGEITIDGMALADPARHDARHVWLVTVLILGATVLAAMMWG